MQFALALTLYNPIHYSTKTDKCSVAQEICRLSSCNKSRKIGSNRGLRRIWVQEALHRNLKRNSDTKKVTFANLGGCCISVAGMVMIQLLMLASGAVTYLGPSRDWWGLLPAWTLPVYICKLSRFCSTTRHYYSYDILGTRTVLLSSAFRADELSLSNRYPPSPEQQLICGSEVRSSKDMQKWSVGYRCFTYECLSLLGWNKVSILCHQEMLACWNDALKPPGRGVV